MCGATVDVRFTLKSGRSLREPLVALTSDFPERKFVVV
jgi:hypothetical protein